MAVTHKTYQLRIYASSAGHHRLDLVLRNCARLYNAALEEWKAAHRHKGHSLSVSGTRYDQMKELTGIRQDDPDFWGALSLQVSRGALVRLDRARQSFFRRVRAGESPGFPRFKPSARWRTIEIAEPSAAMVRQRGKGYAIQIKGLPTLRVRKGTELPPSGELKGITIVRRGRRLWVNLTYRVESKPLSRSDLSVGLDMGVSERIALSTGESVGRRNKANSRIARAEAPVSVQERQSQVARAPVDPVERAGQGAYPQSQRVSQDHDGPGMSLRADSRRGSGHQERDTLGQRHDGAARQECVAEIGTEQVDSGTELGDIADATNL